MGGEGTDGCGGGRKGEVMHYWGKMERLVVSTETFENNMIIIIILFSNVSVGTTYRLCYIMKKCLG